MGDKKEKRQTEGLSEWKNLTDPVTKDEFIFGLELAQAGASLKMPMVSPTDRLRIESEKGSFRLTDTPINRFGLAIADGFRDQPNKAQAILSRWFALQSLSDHPEMKKWTRNANDQSIELHEALFEAAATCPLSPKLEFDPDVFFARVKQIAGANPDTE